MIDRRRVHALLPRKVHLALLVAGFAGVVLLTNVNGIGTPTQSASIQSEEPPSIQDFSKFRHNAAQHTRMPCLVCHVRNDNRTRFTYPGHIPCASCHKQQFDDNKGPICTICHTATGVKAFTGLRSFRTAFDHSKHIRQTNCATCHSPSLRGAGFSVPSGPRGHATCFQCHGPRSNVAGREISSCSVCHKAGRPSRFSQSAKAYAVNFNHSEHAAKRLACTECHKVTPGKISSPIASMHFAPSRTPSCGACHDNKRAFGGRDFKDCRKCHEGGSFKF